MPNEGHFGLCFGGICRGLLYGIRKELCDYIELDTVKKNHILCGIIFLFMGAYICVIDATECHPS